jgi:23S rRNA (adenine2503-C2)-methyltransferase
VCVLPLWVFSNVPGDKPGLRLVNRRQIIENKDIKDIKSLLPDELKQEFLNNSYKKYQAIQVHGWLSKGVTNFSDMTDISISLREALKAKYVIRDATIEKKFISAASSTIKYLLRLMDGEFVECVLMKYHHGCSVCISTQVGCKMGCSFCATGKSGFRRNLYASEMLSQIHSAQNDSGIKISNVVLMGMGEPLDNYDNVVRFLKLVTSRHGLNIGMRRISVSTCGVVDKIYRLADEGLQVTLSVSLHAPDNLTRSKIMPVGAKWKIYDIMEACRYYFKKTNRRIAFEYVLIKGVNDGKFCAHELVNLVRGMNCFINIIPVNSIDGGVYEACSRTDAAAFCGILVAGGIVATVRRTLGADINASCGQLRRVANVAGQ